MTLDAAALLDGPRGRRLCLELMTAEAWLRGAESEALRLAVFEAAYRLDPGRGTSVMRLTAGRSVDPTDAEPVVEPAEVADLLAATPLPDADEPALLRAFATVVAVARSWQEPDGHDVLLADPGVRAALVRVAAHLVGAPAAAWWTAPMDADAQWVVAFRGRPARHAPAAPALAAWREAAGAEERQALRERPRDPAASWSGTWWSTPPRGALLATTRARGALGPLGLWLEEDGYGEPDATARPLPVRAGARVLEIDGPEDWADLCRRCPLEVTASRRHDWYRTTGRDGRWVQPDWSRVAHDADAVHLTGAGYLTAAGRAVPVDDEAASVLAGWNPDETFWLTDPPAPDGPEQTWHRDDDAWRRVG